MLQHAQLSSQGLVGTYSIVLYGHSVPQYSESCAHGKEWIMLLGFENAKVFFETKYNDYIL